MKALVLLLFGTAPVFAANSLTIYEADGVAQSTRPITFGRVFAQGEISSCPQPLINGVAAGSSAWQADVKNRWADGSVKFALISTIVSLSSNGTAAITFQNSALCNNTGFLTQGQMTAAGNWGAQIVVTPAGGSASTIDALTMISNSNPASNTFGDCKVDYFAQGPVLTGVVAEDCTSTTQYDMGCTWNGTTMSACVTGSSASNASLHPKFILWFYSQTQVLAEFVLENAWTGREQDQSIAIQLNGGSAHTSLYSKATFTAISRTIFRKKFYAGNAAALGHILIDHNFAYLKSTKALPNYDSGVTVDPSSDYTTFAGGDKGDVNGKALLGAGEGWGGNDYSSNNEGAPIQREELEYLYNMGVDCGTVNGKCRKAWDILTGEVDSNASTTLSGVSGGGGMWGALGYVSFHFRESRTSGGHFYIPNYADKNAVPSATDNGTVAANGHMLSRHAFPSERVAGGFVVACVGTCTGSTIDTNNDCSHWLDYFYVPYLLTGSPFYLDENYYSASFCLATVNEGQITYGSNGFYAFANPSSGGTREYAWTVQTLARAASVAPDGLIEQSYYQAQLNSNLEILEGAMGITGTPLTPTSTNPTCTNYNYTTANRWDWGLCTYMSQCLNTGTTCSVVVNSALHGPNAGSCVSGSLDPTVQVTASTNANPTQLTTSPAWGHSNSNATDIWGATGNWSAINGAQIWTFVDSTHFTVPVDATSFGAFTGTVYTSDSVVDSTKATDYFQDWMVWYLATVFGEIREIGYPSALGNVQNLSTQLFQRLEEEVQDSTSNPYLIATYTSPLKNGANTCSGGSRSTNQFLSSWSAFRTAFIPYFQTVATFNHNYGWDQFPCADHGYSALGRAAGSFLQEFNISSSDANCPSGTCTASPAWNWLNGHVPYFTNSVSGSTSCGAGDTQIKWALAPRPVISSGSAAGVSGSVTISGATLQ